MTLDKVLELCMKTWVRNTQRRMKLLRNLFSAADFDMNEYGHTHADTYREGHALTPMHATLSPFPPQELEPGRV